VKVRLPVTLEVDEEAWKADYGLATTAEVRADVQSWARNLLDQVSEAVTVVGRV
jgi:hypothetical protein